MRNYIIVDIETTGLSRSKHGITEIAAVKYDGDKVLDEFQILVNPERHIPTKIEKLTGISNDMVADAPVIKDALPEFMNFAGDSIMVAHNAGFDMGFLTHYHYESFGEHLGHDVLCTRKLANRILPDLPSKSLYALCQYYGVTNERAHRALADARATLKIFENFLEYMMINNIVEQEDILLLQDKKRQDCFMC